MRKGVSTVDAASIRCLFYYCWVAIADLSLSDGFVISVCTRLQVVDGTPGLLDRGIRQVTTACIGVADRNAAEFLSGVDERGQIARPSIVESVLRPVA